MISATLLLSASVAAAPTPADRLILDPTDVRAVTRGALALPLDPAAAGAVNGFELSLRSRYPEDASKGDWGLFTTVPIGKLSLLAGYEWLRFEGVRHQRLSLGAAVPLGPYLRFGFAYRYWHEPDASPDASTWDLSLLAEPASWLSIGLGVDQVNQPTYAGFELTRAWRVGAGLRPVRGATWLTLGADTRITTDGGLDLKESHFLVDVAPTSGLHILAAYAPKHEIWLALSLGLESLELRGGVGGTIGGGDTDLVNQSSYAATLRTTPTESLVDLGGRTIEVPLSGKLLVEESGFLPERESVSSVALRLATLAREPRVNRVLLDIGQLDVGLATVQELRASIFALRSAGKEVIATIGNAKEKEYLVAAAASRIRMDPSTTLDLDGFSVTLFYFADTLAKVGVRVDAVEIGRYKTGPDPLVRTSSRPEEREVVNELLALSYRVFVQALVQNEERRLTPEVIERIVSKGLVTPAEAMELKLVDELTQPTDLQELPRPLERGESIAALDRPSGRWGVAPKIVVVPVVGSITMDGAESALLGPSASAREVVGRLEAARNDPSVIGVVMRIDSPGGDVYASELIWRAVRLVSQVKPVVASMADVAASGGYYIAAPADAIFAQQSTITGSIGIFTFKPDLSGLFKLAAVHDETYKVGPHADWESLTRGLTEEERAQVQRGLEYHYEGFLQRVATGRQMPIEEVRRIAEGRVYSGEQALRLGLIDGIGGLDDAVREVKTRAGVEEDEEVAIEIPSKAFSLGAALGNMVRAEQPLVELIAAARAEVERLQGRVLARMPFDIRIAP